MRIPTLASVICLLLLCAIMTIYETNNYRLLYCVTLGSSACSSKATSPRTQTID
ncbi:hypothetical protein K469DRAFT_713961 [Zopfia rhizophila CBS 207.26]|uniref:Uncharacterized protein n=1 Tax=Zopfia rhizophila CBS 207.26 TaxID=1314779 RepID=A0A6A6DQ01_9PEZI|nr:hypothetical protein K469DRAFT_713961 [Zopfia rhizophila CBS 207.26]